MYIIGGRGGNGFPLADAWRLSTSVEDIETNSNNVEPNVAVPLDGKSIFRFLFYYLFW